MLDWPQCLLSLVPNQVARRSETREEMLGPLARYFDQRSKQSPFKQLIQLQGPSIFREASIPCSKSVHFDISRQTSAKAVTKTEAMTTIGLKAKHLERLAAHGLCITAE